MIRTAEKNDPRFIFRCCSCVKRRTSSSSVSYSQSNNQSKSRESTKEQTKKRDSEELTNLKRAAEKRRVNEPSVSVRQSGFLLFPEGIIEMFCQSVMFYPSSLIAKSMWIRGFSITGRAKKRHRKFNGAITPHVSSASPLTLSYSTS